MPLIPKMHSMGAICLFHYHPQILSSEMEGCTTLISEDLFLSTLNVLHMLFNWRMKNYELFMLFRGITNNIIIDRPNRAVWLIQRRQILIAWWQTLMNTNTCIGTSPNNIVPTKFYTYHYIGRCLTRTAQAKS